MQLTLAEFVEQFNSETGLTLQYGVIANNINDDTISLPQVVYQVISEIPNLNSDNTKLSDNQNIQLTLFTNKKDLNLEAIIENALSKIVKIWQVTTEFWNDQNQMLQRVYEFSLVKMANFENHTSQNVQK